LYYTYGRTVFTGALFAIALALLAMSGHSVEQLLLDLAATFAALVAVVPTPLTPGDVPGAPVCPGPDLCVPVSYLPGIRTGVVTFAVLVVLAGAAATVLARVQGTSKTGLAVGVTVSVAVAIGGVTWMLAAPDSFLAGAHLAATAGFFGLMGAVAVLAAITSRGAWRRLYLGVAIGMGVFLVFLAAVMLARLAGADQTGQPWVLAGESGLIVAFAVFWVAQTVQKWAETDPAVVGP